MATGRIGTTPVLTTRWSKAPAAGTTSLSGLDDNSVSLVYSVGYEAVYQNGVLLSRGNDYTATNGTTITLTTATVAGDIIEVFANQTIPLADTYTQTVANGKFINNTLTTTTGDIIYASAANTPARLGIGSTDQVLKVSGGVPVWGAAPTAAFKGVYLTKSSAQSIPITTYTAITWDTESFDTDAFHSTSTNTSRITIPSGLAGYYSIYYQLSCGNGDLTAVSGIAKNGTRINSFQGWKSVANGTGGYSSHLILNLAVGDYIEALVYATNTLQVDSNAQNAQPSVMWAQYLGA
jgi:hypothetical protein